MSSKCWGSQTIYISAAKVNSLMPPIAADVGLCRQCLGHNQYDVLLPAGKAICCCFFLVISYLEMTVVQLNTVEFWGTIADIQEMRSLVEFAFIHKQNKVLLGKCYCNTEYIVLNLIQLLSACLWSRYLDPMQYFMLSSIYNLSNVYLCEDISQPL